MPSLLRQIRARPRRNGAATIGLSFVALVLLRAWVSPIGRMVTGREGVSIVAFLGIPLFLVVLAAGIGLFLSEPVEMTEG